VKPWTLSYPRPAGQVDLRFEALDLARLDGMDVVFVALPPVKPWQSCRVAGTRRRIIDLGGDFDSPQPPSTKRTTEPNPHRRSWTAVYGLPELHKARIQASEVCRQSGAIPQVHPGLCRPDHRSEFEPEGIVINSLSGVSGAGEPMRYYIFTELHDIYVRTRLANHNISRNPICLG